MLEYMLVRTEDRPLLDQSRGKLRWIVLDEAHTYIGSQAAEMPRWPCCSGACCTAST